VLNPGGHLLLEVDTFSAPGEARYRLLNRRRQLRNTTFVLAHPHRFSHSDVVHLVGAAGFRVAQADTPGPVVATVGRHCRVRLLAV
jgi:hypothetical protein